MQKITNMHTPRVRTKIIREMPGLEKSVAKALDSVHKKHFRDYEKILSDQFLYRKTHYEYIKEALSKGQKLDDILNFHDDKAEMEIRRIYKPRTAGQKPRHVLHVNSSEDRSPEIFSQGSYVDESDHFVDGAFAISINVRKDRHFPEDFQPSAYMNRQIIKHDGYALAYEPFIAAFGGEGESRGSSPENEISLAESRRDTFIERYREAGFDVETENGMPYRLCNLQGKVHQTYLPVILHDNVKCEYYVCEGNRRILLEKWLAGLGIDSPSLRKDIEALEMHRREADYFDEYVRITSRCKEAECTDSREDSPQNSTRSSIRIIGAILDGDERRRVLEESPGLEYFTVGLHFGCGYLTTAMKLHEVGWELRRIFEKGEQEGKQKEVAAARNFFRQGVESVMNNTWKGFNLNDLMVQLNEINGSPISISSTSKLHELLKSSTADMREIAIHMQKRNVLSWSEELGTLVAPAAAEIDKLVGSGSALLPHNRSAEKERAAAQQKAYFDSITVRVAKDVEDAWTASFNEVEKTDVKAVRVVIKSYRDGVSYMVGDDGGLYDAFTKEKAVEI